MTTIESSTEVDESTSALTDAQTLALRRLVTVEGRQGAAGRRDDGRRRLGADRQLLGTLSHESVLMETTNDGTTK